MKNILIIYPHWPPSNLAGVHRPRLISNFLPNFNWHPTVLTVKEKYYEEKPDYGMLKTVSYKTEVLYTNAFKVGKIRIIGDIGLRAFFQLKKEALKIIKKKKIDFIWIPIPSFYTAVLGRILFNKTKTPYGIDYIDPWARNISNRKNPRAILSNFVAKILEPIAVKKASLISGVSEKYYLPVIKRNFKNRFVQHIAMPYGFDYNDHTVKLNNIDYPWDNYKNCEPIIYAGAFLPLSGFFTKLLFKSIKKLIDKGLWSDSKHLFFLGTGNYKHKSIETFAKEAGISKYVHEIRNRFPFLHIQQFLRNSYGVIIIGSKEKHYTASKTFQSILSEKPIFSIFHNESSALKILKECNSDKYSVKYIHEEDEKVLIDKIYNKFSEFLRSENNLNVNLEALDKYSAKQSAGKLVYAIEKVIK